AVPGKDREAVRLYVTQQPLYRDERDDQRDREAERERIPVLAGPLATHFQQFVTRRGKHRWNANQEREFGGRGTQGEAGEHRGKDGRGRPGRPRKHGRENLTRTDPEG